MVWRVHSRAQGHSTALCVCAAARLCGEGGSGEGGSDEGGSGEGGSGEGGVAEVADVAAEAKAKAGSAAEASGWWPAGRRRRRRRRPQ